MKTCKFPGCNEPVRGHGNSEYCGIVHQRLAKKQQSSKQYADRVESASYTFSNLRLVEKILSTSTEMTFPFEDALAIGFLEEGFSGMSVDGDSLQFFIGERFTWYFSQRDNQLYITFKKHAL